ncbi:hypothetical protein V6N12_034472 [Hibiscus sabdariffa]|uniref:Uncharacterized protein n=1 Tax=Hibiscus sabdariffa TaxID=183260 RepID=A0ABR2DI85_9ROSI
MSVEFNLLPHGNPSFMLHFKPRFGDFSIKKSQSYAFDKAVNPTMVVFWRMIPQLKWGYDGGASEGKGVGKISLGVEDSIREEEWPNQYYLKWPN